MPSTFVHGILPASCAVMSHRKARLTRKEWFSFFILSSFLANCPDLDIVPVLFFPKYWDLFHRNVGHNFISLSLFITLGYYLFKKYFSKHFTKKQCIALAFSLVLSHIILDALGDYQKDSHRVGVPVLWPLSDYQFKIPFALFMNYQLKTNTAHPLLGHLYSKDFWTSAFWNEIICSLGLFSLWISVQYFYKAFAKVFFRKIPSSVKVETAAVEQPKPQSDNESTTGF